MQLSSHFFPELNLNWDGEENIYWSDEDVPCQNALSCCSSSSSLSCLFLLFFGSHHSLLSSSTHFLWLIKKKFLFFSPPFPACLFSISLCSPCLSPPAASASVFLHNCAFLNVSWPKCFVSPSASLLLLFSVVVWLVFLFFVSLLAFLLVLTQWRCLKSELIRPSSFCVHVWELSSQQVLVNLLVPGPAWTCVCAIFSACASRTAKHSSTVIMHRP